MLESLINGLFPDYRLSEPGDNLFSFSRSWKNIATAYCKNRAGETVRVDIRLAFADVTRENLVDFIDYKNLPDNKPDDVSEYNIVYLGYFSEKPHQNIVSENFLIDKTCKRVSHHYIDLGSDNKLSEYINTRYSEEKCRLIPVLAEKYISPDPSEYGRFGLRVKGIFKDNLPGNPLISVIIPSFNSFFSLLLINLTGFPPYILHSSRSLFTRLVSPLYSI